MTDALLDSLDLGHLGPLDPLDTLDPRLVTNNRASEGDNKRKLNEQANGDEIAPDEKPNDEPKRRKLNLLKCRCCRDARQKCFPVDRVWPTKCDRCIVKGWVCSEPELNPRRQGLRFSETPQVYSMFEVMSLSTSKPYLSNRKPKVRLSMNLGGQTVLATHDSGSEENIISKDLITALGLKIDDSPEQQKEFRMANNKIVKALGGVTIPCKFAREQASEQQKELCCWFYVFNTLITPLIMGMKFLDSTETLTKNKYRLQACAVPAGPLQCASINNPKRRLRCHTLNGGWAPHSLQKPSPDSLALANADTGSEIDLMSLDFCKRRKFVLKKVPPEESSVQFADGSLATLAGRVFVYVTFHGTEVGERNQRIFFVLEDLSCDLLLGEDFLEQTNAFETYKASFSIEDDNDLAQVNTIVWFKTHERFLTGPGMNPVAAPEPLSVENAILDPIPPSRWKTIKKRVRNFLHHQDKDFSDTHPVRNEDYSLPTFEARFDERDARETRRREKAARDIAALPIGAQPAAKDLELEMTRKFDLDRELLCEARNSALLAMEGKAEGSGTSDQDLE